MSTTLCSMRAAQVFAGLSREIAIQAEVTPDRQQGGPDISLLSPRVQSLWDHASNAHLGDIVIKPYSNFTRCWHCTNCPDGHLHKWNARVSDVTRNGGGPFCSGHVVCPHNSFPRKAPHLVPEWDIDTAKNPGSPHDYTACSTHRAHWRCHQGHQWQATILNRVKGNTGCPGCVRARPQQRLPTLIASTSQVLSLWDWVQNTTAGHDPSTLTCGSDKMAHFICHQCPELQSHIWTTRIRHVVRGSGCPCCSHHKVCKCNSLRTLRPDLAAQWCYAKNKGTPDHYTARSNEAVWWENAERGQWKACISHRSQKPPKA